MGHFSAGYAILIILILIVLAVAGWLAYANLRARRLGVPPSYNPFNQSSSSRYGVPQPRPSGVAGWINDKYRAYKNRNQRTAGGAYEESSFNRGRGAETSRGFGPLDPDEAWDARVGNEADAYGPGGYYEEQELGLHPDHGREDGGAASGWGEAPRGRSQHRESGPYNSGPSMETGRSSLNPFDDSAAAELPSSSSMRGISPRPTSKSHLGDGPDSPTERVSMFHESL